MVTESQGKYSKNRKIKSPADEVSCEAMAEIVNGSAKIKKKSTHCARSTMCFVVKQEKPVVIGFCVHGGMGVK